jgi:predicted choloylglycine hydrolase
MGKTKSLDALETIKFLRSVLRDKDPMSMYHPIVKGTYHEMGFRYGAILYKHGFRVQEQSLEKLDFARRSESEVKRVFPEILEEISGFAEACHARYEDMAAFMMSIGAFRVEPMCSVFAAFDGSEVTFGRNYDFYYSFRKLTESCVAVPREAYCSVGHSDVFIGREDGLNEKGLAIAMTGVDSHGNKPGISFVLAVRCVLDKCATVKQGINVLSTAHLTSTHNFLLADSENEMAVVETAPERVKTRKPKDGESFIVCTNHFIHPEMTEKEDIKTRCWDSVPRYERIHQLLKDRKGRIDVRTAQEILSDHTGYVCSHQQKLKLGTIWSIIARLKQLQLLRAEGQPCRSIYRPDMRLNKSLQKRDRVSYTVT